MSGVAHTLNNLQRNVAGWFGLKGTYDKLPLLGRSDRPAAPTPPAVPTLDSAENAANQQQDQMRRRRGVLANIYAGSNAAAPAVSTKTLLGS